jgi:fructose-bisphosphate aldolase, class II
MPLVSMRQLLDHAAEQRYGIPAFNVNNLEQVQAVMAAAQEVGAPVILQASAGARKYAGEAFIKHLILAAIEQYPQVPLVMHQDHGQSPDVCKGAIDLGFSSVMMDGSLEADGKSIASYDYNVEVTRKVVDMAHATGVTVEGELGCLGSLETMKGDKEDGHGTDSTMTREQLLTDPEQAADFVQRTQLDALAIAIGTSHGAYKFTRKPTGDILAIDRIKEIHRRLPNTHLVMHGSSSVPQDLLEIIRKYGGNMKETYGVPVSEIQEAIKFGVRKINIDTDVRLAMTAAVRKFLAENPEKFDAREWLKPAREAATSSSAAKARPPRSSRRRCRKWRSVMRRASWRRRWFEPPWPTRRVLRSRAGPSTRFMAEELSDETLLDCAGRTIFARGAEYFS